jgi:cell division protein FtsQ
MFLNVQTYQSRPKPKTSGRNRPLEEVEAEKKKDPVKLKLGKLKLPVKSYLLYPSIILVLAVVMVGVFAYQDSMPLQSIEVQVDAGHDNMFMSEEEIIRQLEMGEGSGLLGRPMNEIKLSELEAQLNAYPTIEKAEVYKSFMGVLNVEVSLRKAIGRMVNNSGTHLYVDAKGRKFPVSKNHTAYVPLIRGDFEEGLVDTFSCETISDAIPVMQYIQQHEFWKAQVAEIVIAQSGEMEMYLSVGEMKIEFGYPDRIEEKFQNLMDFFRQIAPVMGWKAYKSLSVKYKGQVVGKK